MKISKTFEPSRRGKGWEHKRRRRRKGGIHLLLLIY